MDSNSTIIKILINGVSIKPTLINTGYCHGASCLQANDTEGRKNDRLKKEKEGKGI